MPVPFLCVSVAFVSIYLSFASCLCNFGVSSLLLCTYILSLRVACAFCVDPAFQECKIKPAVDSVHELRDTEAAHRISEGMHAGGKIVVRIRKPWERSVCSLISCLNVFLLDLDNPGGSDAVQVISEDMHADREGVLQIGKPWVIRKVRLFAKDIPLLFPLSV